MATERLPSADELFGDYLEDQAAMPVNQINHREFVRDGIRYFVCYDSRRDPNYKQKKWSDPLYRVIGWVTYKAEPERP